MFLTKLSDEDLGLKPVKQVAAAQPLITTRSPIDERFLKLISEIRNIMRADSPLFNRAASENLKLSAESIALLRQIKADTHTLNYNFIVDLKSSVQRVADVFKEVPQNENACDYFNKESTNRKLSMIFTELSKKRQQYFDRIKPYSDLLDELVIKVMDNELEDQIDFANCIGMSPQSNRYSMSPAFTFRSSINRPNSKTPFKPVVTNQKGTGHLSKVLQATLFSASLKDATLNYNRWDVADKNINGDNAAKHYSYTLAEIIQYVFITLELNSENTAINSLKTIRKTNESNPEKDLSQFLVNGLFHRNQDSNSDTPDNNNLADSSLNKYLDLSALYADSYYIQTASPNTSMTNLPDNVFKKLQYDQSDIKESIDAEKELVHRYAFTTHKEDQYLLIESLKRVSALRANLRGNNNCWYYRPTRNLHEHVFYNHALNEKLTDYSHQIKSEIFDSKTSSSLGSSSKPAADSGAKIVFDFVNLLQKETERQVLAVRNFDTIWHNVATAIDLDQQLNPNGYQNLPMLIETDPQKSLFKDVAPELDPGNLRQYLRYDLESGWHIELPLAKILKLKSNLNSEDIQALVFQRIDSLFALQTKLDEQAQNTHHVIKSEKYYQIRDVYQTVFISTMILISILNTVKDYKITDLKDAHRDEKLLKADVHIFNGINFTSDSDLHDALHKMVSYDHLSTYSSKKDIQRLTMILSNFIRFDTLPRTVAYSLIHNLSVYTRCLTTNERGANLLNELNPKLKEKILETKAQQPLDLNSEPTEEVAAMQNMYTSTTDPTQPYPLYLPMTAKSLLNSELPLKIPAHLFALKLI